MWGAVLVNGVWEGWPVTQKVVMQTERNERLGSISLM